VQTTEATSPAVRDFLAAHRPDMIDELMEWLRVPSVAGLPEHVPDLVRSANWLAAALRATGLPTVQVWDSGDAPAVYAEWCAAPGAPTVLIYGHHDVRAVKPDQWRQTAPFAPVLRDGRIYGRGASDAKGQVLSHLWGIRAHLAATGRDVPAVNLKVIVEGGEETGSTQLIEIFDRERDRLATDLIVYSDTLSWRADHPAVCTSLRGTLLARLEVFGPLRDVHSGAVSGPAPNAALELAKLLATLHDDKGRVTLPGFYDDVTEPSARRRDELAALPFTDEDWLERSETRTIRGEAGYTVLERLWLRPAVEILTVLAGDPAGPPLATVPAVATAELSVRTVGGQTTSAVADSLRRWVAEGLGDVPHELTVSTETAQEPYETPDGLPALTALAEAMRDGFGVVPGRMGNAGGGPAEWMSRKLGAPLVFFGTGLPEDRWHDDDERVSVDMLVNGAATLAHFWRRLGSSGDRPAG
jgi:acetylornithine deacetylase/succinyl-diaminopimelate desuccinylase-like protein